MPEYKSEPVPAPTIRAASAEPSAWLRPLLGRPLEYETVGQARALGFEPLYRIFDERYAVYWKTEVA